MEAHADAKGSAADDGGFADDVFAWLLMEDDGSGGELMNLLDDGKDAVVEEPASTVGRVRFIDDPYSSLLVFQSSSSYITINGNEESCGSSFSDSGTSVMASVDTNGLRKLMGSVEAALGKEERSAWGPSNGTTTHQEEGSVIGNGFAGCNESDCEWDYEVLARFLGEEEEEGLFAENN